MVSRGVCFVVLRFVVLTLVVLFGGCLVFGVVLYLVTLDWLFSLVTLVGGVCLFVSSFVVSFAFGFW